MSESALWSVDSNCGLLYGASTTVHTSALWSVDVLNASRDEMEWDFMLNGKKQSMGSVSKLF